MAEEAQRPLEADVGPLHLEIAKVVDDVVRLHQPDEEDGTDLSWMREEAIVILLLLEDLDLVSALLH